MSMISNKKQQMTKNELIGTRGKRQKTIGGIVPLTQVDNLLTLLLLR